MMSNSITVPEEFDDLNVTPLQQFQSERAQIIKAIEAGTLQSPTIRQPKAHPSVRYNSLTGALESLDPVHSNVATGESRVVGPDSASEQSDEELVEQDADYMRQQVLALKQSTDALMQRLEEVRYDSITGESYYVVQGAERARLEQQIRAGMETALYQAERLEAVQGAKDRAALKQAARDEHEAAVNAFSGGDPRRAKLLAEAIEAEEARVTAQALVARRLSRG